MFRVWALEIKLFHDIFLVGVRLSVLELKIHTFGVWFHFLGFLGLGTRVIAYRLDWVIVAEA